MVKLGNNKNFLCLCIGIGYFGYKSWVIGYVLGKLLVDEKIVIESVIDEVV